MTPVTASGRPLDAALVRELVTERIHLLPPLRWRLAVCRSASTIRTGLTKALSTSTTTSATSRLPSPGDQRQLAEQVAHLIASHLDRARPLWEMYVIHGSARRRGGGVDEDASRRGGRGFGRRGHARPARRRRDRSGAGARHPTYLTRALPVRGGDAGPRTWSGCCASLLRALRAMPTTLPHLDDVPTIRHLPGVKVIARGSRLVKRLVSAAGDGAVPAGQRPRRARRPHSKPGYRRIVGVAFGSLPLDDVKMIKNTFGCTVNDVVVALCAAGLRSWLDERGELPSRTLLGVIPVSVRTPRARWGPSATGSRP